MNRLFQRAYHLWERIANQSKVLPMQLAGLCACPADADPDIKKLCDYVTPHKGGHGAVRDFIHEILEKREIWSHLIEKIY